MISIAYAAAGAHSAAPFYADSAFWVAAAFLVVVVAAFRPASRAILAGLDAYAAGIRTALDEARRLREDAQTMLAEYQRKQRDALKDAEGVLQHARHEVETMKADAAKALDASIKRREQQALDRLAQAETAAVREIRGKAVDIAIAATAALLAQRIGGVKGDWLIDDSIKAISRRAH